MIQINPDIEIILSTYMNVPRTYRVSKQWSMDSLSQELLVYVTQGLGNYQQHMVWIPPWTWITNLWEVIMGGQVWVAYVSHDLDFKDLFFSVMKNFRKPLITNRICFMCFLIKAIHLIWSNYLKKEKPSSSFLVLWLEIVSSSKLICFLCFP